jgi:tRNA-dihydrouridine synthase B
MFPFTPPALLAPMWGVLSPELGELLASYGPVGLVCGSFVRITTAQTGDDWIRSHIVHRADRVVSVQLMGSDPERMAHAAQVASAAGADVIDVNLGCPVRQVVRKGAGAALLREPERLQELLLRVRDRTRGLLSVKLRAGWETTEGMVDLGRRIEACGVDFVTLHPRSRSELYEGVADWMLVAELARALRVPVVGNGDCWYAADALRLQRASSCAAVMIGRPALRNPWIFRQLDELSRGWSPYAPSGADVVGHLSEVATRLERTLGATRRGPLGPLKEHVAWLLRALPNGHDQLQRALRAPSPGEVLATVTRDVGSLPPAALDLDAHGAFRLQRTPALGSDP